MSFSVNLVRRNGQRIEVTFNKYSDLRDLLSPNRKKIIPKPFGEKPPFKLYKQWNPKGLSTKEQEKPPFIPETTLVEEAEESRRKSMEEHEADFRRLADEAQAIAEKHHEKLDEQAEADQKKQTK